MPAKSEAQRRYLAAKFGPTWMRKHGFDNEGKLPERAPGRKNKPRARHDAVNKMLQAGK